MPFPVDQKALMAAGYSYSTWQRCPVCSLDIEVWTSPGKRIIQMDPMPGFQSPAIRHFETCNNLTNPVAPPPVVPVPQPSPEPQTPHSGSPGVTVAMHGVTDPNHQLIAVGWFSGTLVCQWAKGKGQHTGVPENIFITIRRVPFAYSYYQKTIKGKYPYTKLN